MDSQQIARRYDSAARYFDPTEAPLEWLVWKRWRKKLISHVSGNGLEIGVGTGKNLPFYPEATRLIGIDISPRMLGYARKRAQSKKAHLVLMDAQHLGFPSRCFDWVAGSFVFCTIPDPSLALQEIRRVLRPSGLLLLLEHVRSPLTLIGKIQDWLTPVWLPHLGCHLNRNTISVVRAAGFSIRRMEPHFGGVFTLVMATVN